MRYALLSIAAAVFLAAGSAFSGEQASEPEKTPALPGRMEQKMAQSVANSINEKNKELDETLSDN